VDRTCVATPELPHWHLGHARTAALARRTGHYACVSEAEFVGNLSAAMREFDVLEPWLTESHWDQNYWDDVALAVAAEVGPHPSRAEVIAALRNALSARFGELASNNGLFRDQLERRLALIAERVGA
jgi:hypothetical protein